MNPSIIVINDIIRILGTGSPRTNNSHRRRHTAAEDLPRANNTTVINNNNFIIIIVIIVGPAPTLYCGDNIQRDSTDCIRNE